MTQFGFIPRRQIVQEEEYKRGGAKMQHIELTKRIRNRAARVLDEELPLSSYVQYKRDGNHETRVAVPGDSLRYVSEFELLRDEDGFVEWVCIPPGICVACTHNLCWFHEPGASKTYNDLMYELGDAMDKGQCSIDEFYWRMETFYRVKQLDRDLRGVPHGDYPHRHLNSKRILCSSYGFINRILVRAPKGLIHHLVEEELIPPKKELKEHADQVILIACGNPDPTASVLQYLVEDAKLVDFGYNTEHLLGLARTEQTIRFLLKKGLNCKGIKLRPIGDYSDENTHISYIHVELQFVFYPMPPSQKAGILRALFEYGADFPLERWSFIDLDSFRVIEQFRPREEIVSWIEQSHFQICNDREYHTQIWPYLCLQYGFQFTAEEIIHSLLVNNGPGDFQEEDFTAPGFILTYKWIRDHFRLRMVHIEWFFQRLATVINYNNNTPIPFAIAANLSILDKYLIWNRHTTQYFSRALKRRLFTLFCVFRRQFGSTLMLKPMLPQIVPRMVSVVPYEKEEDEDSICQIQ